VNADRTVDISSDDVSLKGNRNTVTITESLSTLDNQVYLAEQGTVPANAVSFTVNYKC